jgi:hypothetical protein
MVRNGLGREADYSYWQCYEALDGPIAQLDRVTDFYSVGCRFESCWDRQQFQGDARSASTSAKIAEAEMAKALGYELRKCEFPPTPMLTIGYVTANQTPATALGKPVFECPRCGSNN